jgi:hypothetical protein
MKMAPSFVLFLGFRLGTACMHATYIWFSAQFPFRLAFSRLRYVSEKGETEEEVVKHSLCRHSLIHSTFSLVCRADGKELVELRIRFLKYIQL